MARSNSKYFASVITKLIAAKRKENIVIDESFKTHLRSELLTRAAGPFSGTQPIDIGQLFARWKYAFALVPSALVVMLVAAQFLQMPVNIPSEQIIPTATRENPVSEEETTGKASVVESEDRLNDSEMAVEDVSLTPSTKKLRTFPGALVMPTTPGENVAIQSLPSKNEQSQPVKVEDSENINKVLPISTMPLNVFGFDVNVLDTKDTVSAHREERTTNNEVVKVVDEPATVLKVKEPVKIVHVEDGQEAEQEGTVPMIGDAGGVVEEHVPVTLLPETVVREPAREIIGGTVKESTEAQQIQTVAPIVQFIPSMEYGVVLQSAEQKELENRIVPSLANGRDVTNVYVSEKENGIISVEIRFENGEKVQKFYTFNKRTGRWDGVEYVTRYYYDNSLIYTTNFVYQVSP